MFASGQQKTRKTSPATAKFFSKVNRNAQELLKSTNEITKKQREKALEDLLIDMNYARSGWEQVHGKGMLVDQLKNSAFVLMEYRIFQDYGDYLAKSLDVVKSERKVRDQMKSNFKLSWDAISTAIQHDEWKLKAAQDRNDEYPPDTPWLDDVEAAVTILETGITTDHLAWEIKEYAKRNRHYHNGLDGLIEKGDWMGLAAHIARDLQTLDSIFPASRLEDRNNVKQAIMLFSKRYFHFLYVNQHGVGDCESIRQFWDRKIGKGTKNSEKKRMLQGKATRT